MQTSPRTPRQSFRDVLAQVAEQARALLPAQVNGRLESAATLVLQGDVFFKDDGTCTVGSADPTRYYRLVDGACTCTDFVQGRAPQGWCKHKIAANLQRSVERVLARRGEAEARMRSGKSGRDESVGELTCRGLLAAFAPSR